MNEQEVYAPVTLAALKRIKCIHCHCVHDDHLDDNKCIFDSTSFYPDLDLKQYFDYIRESVLKVYRLTPEDVR